jgi:uncharacterized membrane protein YGL010W
MEIIVIAVIVAIVGYALFKAFSPAKEIDNAIKSVQADTAPTTVVVEGAGAVEVAPAKKAPAKKPAAKKAATAKKPAAKKAPKKAAK